MRRRRDHSVRVARRGGRRVAAARLMVDYENAAETWWTEGGHDLWEKYGGSMRDDEIEMTDAEAARFFEEAQRIPGWEDGPSYAPNPVIEARRRAVAASARRGSTERGRKRCSGSAEYDAGRDIIEALASDESSARRHRMTMEIVNDLDPETAQQALDMARREMDDNMVILDNLERWASKQARKRTI